jgi:hypothetical protein
MKIVFIIAILFLLTGLRSQDPRGIHAAFPQYEYEKVGEGSENKPTVELFHIRTTASSEEVIIELVVKNEIIKGSYEVYNIFGIRVQHGRITGRTTTLSTAALPKGIYLLRVIADKKQSTKKFLVR